MIQSATSEQKKVETKDILTFAVELGTSMLENGAEIYRIEESISRILQSYDVEHFDVYVLSNGIFASANEDEDDACSLVRHIPKYAVNLDRIAKLNQLCRNICSHDTDFESGWAKLKEIRKQPVYPNWLLMLACGVGSAGFCYLFGGNALDSVFAFFIGAIEEFLLIGMGKASFSRSVSQVFASMFVTVVSYLSAALLSLDLNRDKIVIGAIMVLVPGIVFTTGIRDFYNGDYLSGAIHLLDALLTAVCIVAGVVVTVAFFRAIGLGVLML